jgi:hypothetical protein
MALYQGTTLVVPLKAQTDLGFSPCMNPIAKHSAPGVCVTAEGRQDFVPADTWKSASIFTTYGFVSGHDFSRAVKAQTDLGFSPCMNPISKHSPPGVCVTAEGRQDFVPADTWKSASNFTTSVLYQPVNAGAPTEIRGSPFEFSRRRQSWPACNVTVHVNDISHSIVDRSHWRIE